MSTDFPLNYIEFSSTSIEVKFDKNYLKSIRKDSIELKKFFDCAIADENFWNSLTLKMKQRIIKAIEVSEDYKLKQNCIHSIREVA